MTAPGWPLPSANMSRSPATPPILDESLPFLEGRLLEPQEHDSFFTPGIGEEKASLFEHCARALDSSLAQGGHGLPLIGGRRLERRHEPRRRARRRRERVAWLAALCDFEQVCAFGADARGESRARGKLARPRDSPCRPRLSARAGTANGTGAASSTTERRLAQAKARNAGSTASPNPGPRFPARRSTERATLAMASVERELIRPQEGLAPLFAPPFDKTTLDPGYIKGYPPGDSGEWRPIHPCRALVGDGLRQTRPGRQGGDDCFRCSIRSITPAHGRTCTATRSSPMSSPPMSTPSAPCRSRRLDLVHGLSRLDAARRAWKAFLGMRLEGDRLCVDPCIPKEWPGFEASLQLGLSRYEIRVENPEGVEQGVVRASVDGADINERPLKLKFADDGAPHRLVIQLG